MNLKRRRRRRCLLLVAVLALITFAAFLHFRYLPLVRTIISVKIENEASDLIVAVISRHLAEGEFPYEQIIQLHTDRDGRVTALTADMAAVNRLKLTVLDDIGSEIREMSVEELSVPLGNVIAPALLSGRGGYIPVRLVELKSSGAQLESRFTQAGINQTLHELILEVHLIVTVLTPGGLVTVPVSVQTTVAQTVIVGEIPQTVFQMTGE